MTPEELKHELNMIALTCKPVVENEDAWQKHATPEVIINQMLDMYYSKKKFNNSEKILVLFNVEFIKGLYDRFKDEVRFSNIYFVADCQEKFDAIKNEYPEIESVFCDYHDVKYLVDKIGEFKVKKFDVVFSNPPYNGVDLKILRYLFNKDITKSFSWIAPIRWLQDPAAMYKQGTTLKKFINDGIYQKIQKIKIIPAKLADELFSAEFSYDLGILIIDKDAKDNYIDLSNPLEKSILEKILGKTRSIDDYIDKECLDGIRIKFNYIGFRDKTGRRDDSRIFYYNEIYNNGYQNGKYWTENVKAKGKYSRDIGEPIPASIKFRNLESAKNCYESYLTNFMHFLNHSLKRDVHIPLRLLPCMLEEKRIINGKEIKGYDKPWTDEDFYKFFNITEDEIKYINETIKSLPPAFIRNH